MSKGSVLFPVNKYNIYLQVKTVQSMFHRYYLLWFLLRNEVKQSLDWFWPKIYLIFYPSFGNLTTQITIINTYILCIPLRIGSVFFLPWDLRSCTRTCLAVKGQLISECPYWNFKFSKNSLKNLTDFCPRI